MRNANERGGRPSSVPIEREMRTREVMVSPPLPSNAKRERERRRSIFCSHRTRNANERGGGRSSAPIECRTRTRDGGWSSLIERETRPREVREVLVDSPLPPNAKRERERCWWTLHSYRMPSPNERGLVDAPLGGS